MQKDLWWIKPYNLILGIILPVFILIYLMSNSDDYYKNYFTLYYFLLGLLFILIMTATSYIFSKVLFIRTYKVSIRFSPLWMDILAILTIAAYLIWFWDVFNHPELLVNIVMQSETSVRGEISTIPGITTLVHLGMVYSIYYAIYRWRLGIVMKRRFNWYVLIIILLAAIRTIAWSERLGLIEVFLPLILIFLTSKEFKKPVNRGIIKVAPYLGLIGLIVFFGAAEYFRSWAAEGQYGSHSLLSYMVERFYLYYQTSLNNGCGLLTEMQWPELKGQYSLLWLYNFPIIGENLSDWVGISHAYSQFLNNYGRLGFTTFSGIYPVFYDFGLFGGFFYAAIWGGCLGMFYSQFSKINGPGLLLYPVTFAALTETLRLLYMGTTHIFPVVAFILIGYFLLRKTLV